MKIFTKKSVIFTAFAAVLLATALVISCNDPLDGNSDKEEPSKPGTGKVRLTIDTRKASRTILPTSLPANTKYLLKLDGGGMGNTNGDSGAFLADFYETVTAGSSVAVNNIPIGTYQSAQVFVYVKASTDFVPGTDVLADLAIGEAAVDTNSGSGFSVATTGTTILGSHAPTLYAPGSTKAGTGTGTTGTLSYNLTKSVGATRLSAVSFIIKERSGAPYTGPGSSKQTVTFGTAGSVANIPNGYYNVVYTLEDTTTPTAKTASFYEILHVYKGLTSVLNRPLDDSVFPVPAGTGNGQATTITPVPVGNVTLSGTLSTTSGSGVTATSTGMAWNVVITKGTTNANITVVFSGIDTALIDGTNLTGAIPSTSIGFGAWNKTSGTAGPLSSGNGFVYSYNSSNATLTVTINDVTPSFPLDTTTTPTSVINITVPEITYNSEDYTVFVINISFVD